MVSVTEIEKNFRYHFEVTDWVDKVEDWGYYKIFQNTAGGSKVVDFIAIDHEECWLIECKDYRLNASKKLEEVALELAEKFRDTLACLVSASCRADTARELQKASLAISCDAIRLVVHIEPYRPNSRLAPAKPDMANLKLRLSQLVRAIDKKVVVLVGGDALAIVRPERIGP